MSTRNRAWSDFEFIPDGVFSGVDVILLSSEGFFPAEIESEPGRLEGYQVAVVFSRPDGGGSPTETR